MGQLVDWYLTDHNVQVYADVVQYKKGWIQAEPVCPCCKSTWVSVAALGNLGIECPHCYWCDPRFVWGEHLVDVDLRKK